MVAGLQQLDHHRVGLGLGGEVGAGELFDGAAGAAFALGLLLEPGQRRTTEIDHLVGLGGDQVQHFQQLAVARQQLGVRLQEGADLGPVDGRVGQRFL